MNGHGEGGTMEVLQVPEELDRMRALYWQRKPRRVLEIGCWDGGTLREWLQHAPPRATVVAIDLDHRNRDAYEEWRKPSTSLIVHTGRSQDADAIRVIEENAPYEWVFIDGEHGEGGVSADVANTRPHVRPGGVMLLHDIQAGSDYGSDYPPLLELRKLAAEGIETEEWVSGGTMPWAHGIGVAFL